MKLSKQQFDIIATVAADYLVDTKARLYLYGAQTDSNAMSDTIELLVVVDTNHALEHLQLQKYRLIRALKNQLDYKSIEMSIITQPQLEQPSYQMAISNAICLI